MRKHFFPSNFPLASRTWCCLFISFTYQFHFMLAINRITMLQWKILSALPFAAPQTLSRPLACLPHRNLCKLIKLKCWWWKFLPFSQCFFPFHSLRQWTRALESCVCSLDFGIFCRRSYYQSGRAFSEGSKVGKCSGVGILFFPKRTWASEILELTRLFPMASQALFTSASLTNMCSIATDQKNKSVSQVLSRCTCLSCFRKRKFFRNYEMGFSPNWKWIGALFSSERFNRRLFLHNKTFSTRPQPSAPDAEALEWCGNDWKVHRKNFRSGALACALNAVFLFLGRFVPLRIEWNIWCVCLTW